MVKQQLTIHSEDRDIKKYPSSNHFEVELPVDYKNVSEMQMNDIDLPANLHVFTNTNQNTRVQFTVHGLTFVVQITEGTYRPLQMAHELAGQMNAVVGTTGFSVHYNKISHKFVFFNSIEPFTLDFTASQFDTYYDNYAAWGLGFHLGFHKHLYDSVYKTVPFYWNQSSYTGWAVEAPECVDLVGDTRMYLEMFLFNSMDEIMPFTERSSSLYHAKQGGKHNAAFAKIPLGRRHSHDGDQLGHVVDYHSFTPNVFWSEPPLERIQKLKFKFRFHDGRLVDFGTADFSFTLQLTLIRSDVPKFSKE